MPRCGSDCLQVESYPKVAACTTVQGELRNYRQVYEQPELTERCREMRRAKPIF